MRAMYWKISTFASTGVALLFAIRSSATTPPHPSGSGEECGPGQAAPAGPASWLGALFVAPPSADVLVRANALVSKLRAARSMRAECEVLTEMAESGNEELTQTIIDFASKPGGVKLCAIEALGKVRGGAARSWLADLVHVADAQVRLAAIDALAARENDPEASSILFDAARDGSPEVRTRALVALGHLHAEGAAPMLGLAIRGSDSASQADLVSALGETRDPSAIPLLAELVKTGSSDGRQAAIRALGSLGGDLATQTLAGILKSGGSADTTLAVQALAEINDPGAESALVEAASDARPDVAEAAVRSLADRDGEDVRDVMTRALASDDPRLAGSATTYFASHRDEGAVSQLLEIARRGNSASPEAVSALAAIGGDTARSALADVASRPGGAQALALRQLAGDPSGREEARRVALQLVTQGGQCANHAIETLAADGTDEARDALVRVSRGGGALAGQAVNVLARRGDPESMRALRDAASSNDENLRLQALSALGSSGREEAAPILAAAVRDKDSGVRSSALHALAQLGGPAAERAIAETAASPDASARLLAVQALAQRSVPNSATALEKLAHDPDAEVARDALRALADAAPDRALPLVEDAMRLDSPAARLSALGVAASLDADPQARILLAGVHDADPVVVRSAATQLARLGGP